MEQGLFQFIFIMMILFTVLNIFRYRKADEKTRKWILGYTVSYIVLAIFAGYLAFS